MPAPVISIAQMREWEKATWASGRTEAEVIRLVGQAIARHALSLTRPGDRILILAGKGHNGEDAKQAAEHLAGRSVEVFAVKSPETDLPGLETALKLEPALVVDGLFGIGINRALDAAWVDVIRRINAARLPVLSVDVPSGLDADTGEAQGAAVEAAVTLTVGAPKKGMLEPAAWQHVGRLEVAGDVGLISCPLTSELEWTLPADFAGFPPRRGVASHKGTHGRLAIMAGSRGYHGAAVLAARGAQRARPGLISLFTHESAYTPVAAQLQAVMVHPWSPEIEMPGEFNAVFVGPGLAAPDLPVEMVHRARRWWKEIPIPMVVDASALSWLEPGAVTGDAFRVITPHPGEAGRLLNSSAGEVQANRPEAVRSLSKKFGNCWVVLKGHETLVGGSAGKIGVNCSGNPYLGQGGAGDLLGGYLAGLLAQPALLEDPFRTIRFAVWQHGAAADLLDRGRANWTVEDLAETLGGAGV